ncbi:HET domain protein [Aspergillus homomorphus CBS 101889]|uniref:HET-domain-containing protein n=1 Tax=Aspergillus homomorphus (strain CBS 101889) TaxID=1450537 RepID=A0A395HFL3_ASPHC|nr:HET-domain-containing protein [Aspergillus homomorphus CBS 101889]RAL06647.1 HET-domain-containing protein [Aspergillus homomorphus CBS 101889]
MVYDKKLCSKCSDYFSSESFWHMSYGRGLGYLFQRSFLNLRENSSECTLCGFIYEALLQACKKRGPRERWSIDSDDVLYYSRVLHGEFDTDTAPHSHQTFRLRVSTDYQYTLGGNLDISVIRDFQRPARGEHIEIDVAMLGERMFLQGRRMEQCPDTDLVKSWLQFCCGEGGSRCASEPMNSYKLINVDAMMVEQMKTKSRYAALSYVWGKDTTKHFRLTEDLRAVLSTPGSLDKSRQDIPLVFLDAIQLCRTLGIGYLWIDALCHDKTRTTLSKELPTAIAQIYSNAFVTIVASGKDALSGLPGISTKREVQLTRQFGETTIAVVQPQIDIAMADSDWMKRGWTFDEYVRSNHLLVVTDDQLYFKCKKQDIILCEDMWYESPDYLGTTMRKIELPSVDGLWGWNASDDEKGFFAYTLAVYEYFSRQMTQQKDLALGFDGWREFREKEIGKNLLYNLPVSEFARALCFELRGCERRKPGKDWSNNLIYTPSWSWQGWVGSENDMIEYISAWSFDTPSMQFYRFRKDGNAQECQLFPFPEQNEPTKEDLEFMLGMLSMWRKLSQTHPEKLSRYWKADIQRLKKTQILTMAYSQSTSKLSHLRVSAKKFLEKSTVKHDRHHRCYMACLKAWLTA